MRRALFVGLGTVGGIVLSATDPIKSFAFEYQRPLAPPGTHVPSRSEQIRRFSQGTSSSPFDVLIIGGGATGTGCALDAVTRGLSTALIERDDFAAGTSSRSTKLVHGGVRYLEKAFKNLDRGQLKLVFEALHERKTVLDIAPHLCTPLPIMTVRFFLSFT